MFKLFGKWAAAAVLTAVAASAAPAADLPVLRFTYGPSLNETSFIVPLVKGDAYVRDGYSMHPLIPKEKYEFRKDGKPLAVVDIVFGKGAADMAMLIGQGHADMGVFSLCGAIAAIDQGIKIKVVSPYILATGGLAVHTSVPAKTWDEFIAYIRQSKTPVKIGYHSPTSAPILILRNALASEGLTATDDPYDAKADILYVNLKGIPNMQPALASGQVDAGVGPDPFPQLAEQNGYGVYVRALRQMPPDNKWANFPCCVMSASEKFIEQHGDLVEAMVTFLNASGKWCTENPVEACRISGAYLGLDPEAGKATLPTYLHTFTESWLAGAAGSLKILDETGFINGTLKNKTFDQARDAIIDTRFIH